MSEAPASCSSVASADARYHVPNLERALALLEALSRCPGGACMSDLQKMLGFPKNSVFRIMSTLEHHGYVQRDSQTHVFQLTYKLLSIAHAAVGEGGLVEKAADCLRALRDNTGETALLGIRNGTEGCVLAERAALHPVKFSVSPGTHFPLHTSAPGKALLAFLPAEELEALLPTLPLTKYTDRTITNRKRLAEELAAVREKGYALDQGEELEGLFCVGAPVLDREGYPVAALWVTGPSYRFGMEGITVSARHVCQAAARLSTRLGYQAG